jgi:hypothetical protein
LFQLFPGWKEGNFVREYHSGLVSFRTLLVFGLAAVSLAAQAPQSPRVGIVFSWEQKPDTASLERMQRETEALLRDAGINMVWVAAGKGKRVPQQLSSERFDGVMFVRFKGACRPDLLADPASAREHFAQPVRLAAARVVQGKVTPWTEVECDQVKRSVDSIPLKQRSAALGGVLARVVAHELYHVLLRTTSHGAQGLSRAVLNWDDLIRKPVSFDPADSARIELTFH